MCTIGRDVHVVFLAVYDMVLYVAGTGDIDEFQRKLIFVLNAC